MILMYLRYISPSLVAVVFPMIVKLLSEKPWQQLWNLAQQKLV